MKEIQPILNKILEEFPKLSGLSNDQLRSKTQEFKKRIAEHSSKEQNRIDEIRKTIDADISGDAFFPTWDLTQWTMISAEKHAPDEKNKYGYCFQVWECL